MTKNIERRIEKLSHLMRKQANTIPNISPPKLKSGNTIKVPEIGEKPKPAQLVSNNKKVNTQRTEPPNLKNKSSGPEFQSKMNRQDPYKKR